MGARPWRSTIAAVLLTFSVPNAGAQSVYTLPPGSTVVDAGAATATAPGWRISPDIRLTETYNDNSTLAASGAKRGDFITQIMPGLRIDGRGPRIRGSFDYHPTLLLHARHSSEDQLINTLNAFATLEAVEKFFFMDVIGSVTQTYLSPFGARPADVAISTSNRTETRTFGLSPYFRGVVGGGYNYELRNRNLWTHADTNLIANTHTNQWSGRLASPVRSLLGWAVEGESSKIHRENFTAQPDLETRLARALVFFQPDYAWRFSVSGGREENNYTSLSQMQSNSIYGAGVKWTPSGRTSANLQYERRFFGPSQLAQLTHRTRLTAWNVTYSRNTSDFQQEVLRLPPGNALFALNQIFAARIPDPVERQRALAQFFNTSGTPLFLSNSLAFYTEQIFLEKRLEASAGIVGVQNSIFFTVFASDSERISEGLTGILPDAFLLGKQIKQKGFSVSANHKLTPSATATATGTRTQSEQREPSVVESWNDSVAFTVNHTVSPKTTTFAGVSYTAFKTETAGVTAGVTDAKAHSAFVGLTHRF